MDTSWRVGEGEAVVAVVEVVAVVAVVAVASGEVGHWYRPEEEQQGQQEE